ncbi:TetR/AcrR family transcriptional regulator [Amycolatopsis sp. OK19-0408]|uniref:TetR/AcrR family transcriptional regulator n=1 Tax=Amycolatopsis iheyensis TaxID=2945988 RepID=A0A9X2NIR8_9PSEU|nr:TetR/AcrR family transcriptional regulator [Amycolatopsis iheyensis]MCR6488058.1 TetR/AcrR family transcriptional regulator [Amycolatopsis iheyensis]
MTRNRRADAERNRRHLVAVAHQAFARHGTDLPVREIARRAGLAPATVHRHFPSREDLVDAVFARRAEACGQQLAAALDDPDSRRALSRTFHRFGEWQVGEGPLTDAMLARPAYAALRREHTDAFTRLVERAGADGVLKPGISVEDVRIALMALTSVRALPRGEAPVAVRRLTAVLLAGLVN